MGKETAIAWCHHTFNPWWGCQRVSPGCEKCYAETFSKRVGLKVWGPAAGRRFFPDKHWDEPLKWNRMAEKAGQRRRVFCASMADVFEERFELVEHRVRLWKLIEATPWLDWLLLTKRPENHEMVPLAWQTGSRRPLNVWLGCTAENQEYADRRIPELLRALWPAVRFVSYEPALDLVDFSPWLRRMVVGPADELTERMVEAGWSHPGGDGDHPPLDWVIVGGESGPGARSFGIGWARSTIEQCRAAGVACFVKQLGAHPMVVSVGNDRGYPAINLRLKDRKGGDMEEWDPDLRIREFPQPRSTP